MPSIEVGAGGSLVVTYYDFRNDTAASGEADGLLGRVLLAPTARSRPAGATSCG